MTDIQYEVLEFKRKMLAGRLKLITDDQLEFFNRIFPDGVPPDKLDVAIDLCDRTITMNKQTATSL